MSLCCLFFFFKQKTADEMRISDWSSDVCSSDPLLCIARATGKIRWINQLKHYENAKKKKNPMNWTGPVLAGGRLILVSTEGDQIGRASCRERVCQYV